MSKPTVAEARAYIGVPATTLPDPDLERIYNACDEAQTARCRIPTDDTGADVYPDSLGQALLRRIQREVSAKNLPLGMVGVDATEYGPQRLPFYDAIVEETERPYRIQVLA